jgi:hypothetical protein
MLCIKPGTYTSYFTIPQCDGLWDKCKITQDTLIDRYTYIIDTDILCEGKKNNVCPLWLNGLLHRTK